MEVLMSVTSKKPFYSLPNENPTKTQERLSTAIQQVVSKPLIHGIFLDDVSLCKGYTYIEHGLGERVRYWMVVDKDALSNIYRAANDTSHSETRFIRFSSSAQETVSLYLIAASPSTSAYSIQSQPILM
jgi:hypothetical protein